MASRSPSAIGRAGPPASGSRWLRSCRWPWSRPPSPACARSTATSFHERARTKEINLLAGAINHYGGYKHLLACGQPVTAVGYVSILAWYSHLNVGKVGHRPQYELRQKYPIVLFTQLHNGWAMTPYRTPASVQGCPHALFVSTPHRPNGIFSPH